MDEIKERVATLEEGIKHLATKADLKDVKIWCLSGVVAGMILASGVAASIAVSIMKIWPT